MTNLEEQLEICKCWAQERLLKFGEMHWGVVELKRIKTMVGVMSNEEIIEHIDYVTEALKEKHKNGSLKYFEENLKDKVK